MWLWDAEPVPVIPGYVRPIQCGIGAPDELPPLALD